MIIYNGLSNWKGCLRQRISQSSLAHLWSFGWSLDIFLRQSQLEGFGVEILRHQTKLLNLDLDTHIAAPVVTQSDLSQQMKRRRVQTEHTGDDPLQDVHDFVLHYLDSPRFYCTSLSKETQAGPRNSCQARNGTTEAFAAIHAGQSSVYCDPRCLSKQA